MDPAQAEAVAGGGAQQGAHDLVGQAGHDERDEAGGAELVDEPGARFGAQVPAAEHPGAGVVEPVDQDGGELLGTVAVRLGEAPMASAMSARAYSEMMSSALKQGSSTAKVCRSRVSS